ncbi:MAG: hypothetical protein AAF703_22840 [Cyanobacteria bacterium P01_D01_bin.105]
MTEVLAALLGTFVGGLISWITNVSTKKTQATFDMKREFDSPSMYQSRTIAHELLKKHPTITIDDVWEQYPDKQPHLWQIASFYNQLWIAIKYRQVKLNLVPELFGEAFIWWYVCFFKERYIPKYQSSQTAKQLHSLRKWMNKHADKADMNDWEHFALEELRQYKLTLSNDFDPASP